MLCTTLNMCSSSTCSEQLQIDQSINPDCNDIFLRNVFSNLFDATIWCNRSTGKLNEENEDKPLKRLPFVEGKSLKK